MTIDLKEPDMIALDIDGEITSKTMAIDLDELIRLSTDIKAARCFTPFEIFSFRRWPHWPWSTKKLPSLFNVIRKFDRIAVLADARWIKTGSEIEGKLIRGLEIKACNLDKEEQALWPAAGIRLEWLSGLYMELGLACSLIPLHHRQERLRRMP